MISQIARALTCDGQPLCVGGGKGSALASFLGKVRAGGAWDYKAEILQSYGEFATLPDGDRWYFDIWTNIHYGYVGASVGFSEEELQRDANIGNWFIEGFVWDRIAEHFGGTNDFGDELSIHIGYGLWQDNGPDLTVEDVISAVETWQPIYEYLYNEGLDPTRRVY